MSLTTNFNPSDLYCATPTCPIPRVFASPSRYIQGPGTLQQIGQYIKASLPKCNHAVILASNGGFTRSAAQIEESLQSIDCKITRAIFGGETSLEEISRHAEALKGEGVDVLIVNGGGKAVDAGKVIAFRLGVPCVVAPSLASNDSPCSALSIVYKPDGTWEGIDSFPSNPLLVVVDTTTIAKAPVRYLVSGMGDALGTWYEAAITTKNQIALNCVGARPTLAGLCIGEKCASVLYEVGLAAVKDCKEGQVTEAVEAITEANTLLSGLGFESGGLACAHALAAALTSIHRVENNFMHGEQVALGVLTQLQLEDRVDEAKRATEFCARVGLPCHFGHLTLDVQNEEDINIVTTTAATNIYMKNMPGEPTANAIAAAMKAADLLGKQVVAELGDEPFRALH